MRGIIRDEKEMWEIIKKYTQLFFNTSLNQHITNIDANELVMKTSFGFD